MFRDDAIGVLENWLNPESGCEVCPEASVGETERTPSCNSTGPTRHYQSRALCDFWLFSKMKMPLKGSRFRRDNAEWDVGVEYDSKRNLQKLYRQ
ncbi:hypothetical protein TNCV_1885181 [Trichonephila clavipes]|nr:hypothetical protein TNCV_1885181 [Trichonephila clavipes]